MQKVPYHLKLLAGELNGYLLNLSIFTHHLLDDLNATWRRGHCVDHLLRLQLNHLWLSLWLLLLHAGTTGARRTRGGGSGLVGLKFGEIQSLEAKI